MAYEFKLPDLGEGLTEGEIARWLVAEGQEIAEDDPLVEIATDKTTVEIPSPAAGTVTQILAQEGDVVPVGTVIVVIGGDGVKTAAKAAPERVAPAAASAPPARDQVRATPLVRRLAQELGVDLATVIGTGPQGRITEQDVRGGTTAAAPAAAEGRREPIRGIRRQMLEHLTRAHEIPAVTWVEEADFSDLDLKQLLPRALQAVASALHDFPELNARIDGGDLVLLDRYDIGIAVQTEQGLVVPVVRGCDTHSLEELDAEVRRLAEAAHAGKLAPEELRGGTFTVTSAGRAAGLFVTPLINHPEVAILGIHRIEERAVVRDGEVVVRRMGNVSVTFDHRVIDGKRAADFGLAVIAQLSN
ncbi:MAG TPA: dihydrolipoamide acetyltransferase family protein [Gaiellaceae bacterium]|jgi:pyruvate dehydrogenase E2 component (dihydrolipoamide acetyltransferase)|nr:dihydrolipoamide acetyltransferase family protein [Gaiellaceae bacterium]